MIETIALIAGGTVAGLAISEFGKWLKLMTKDDELTAAEKTERDELRAKLATSYFKTGESRDRLAEALAKLEKAKNYITKKDISQSSYSTNMVWRDCDMDAAREAIIAVMLILSELKERV